MPIAIDPWLKMRINLVDDPVVIRLSADMGLDRHYVIGKLYAVWSWFTDHTRDGVTQIQPDTIDEALGLGGFIAKLIEVGWVEVQGDNLLVADWERHLSPRARYRAYDNTRHQSQRMKHGDEHSNVEIPSSLNKPEFIKVWNQFLEYRTEKKRVMTSFGATKAFSKILRDCGDTPPVEYGIAALNHTMERDWVGVYHPSEGRAVVAKPAEPIPNVPQEDVVAKMREEDKQVAEATERIRQTLSALPATEQVHLAREALTRLYAQRGRIEGTRIKEDVERNGPLGNAVFRATVWQIYKEQQDGATDATHDVLGNKRSSRPPIKLSS